MRGQALARISRPRPSPKPCVALAAAALAGGCATAPPPIEVDLGERGALPAVVEVAPSGAAAAPEPPQPVAFEPWSDELRARARQSERPIFLVVCAAWAVQCAELERDVLTAPAVERMARAYVAARLDVTEATPAIDRTLAALRVDGVPTILLLNERDEARRTVPPSASAEELARALDEFARRE